jgi:hypothetical protein
VLLPELSAQSRGIPSEAVYTAPPPSRKSEVATDGGLQCDAPVVRLVFGQD